MKHVRIPKKIKLPGMTIKVRLVPQSELENDCDAAWYYGPGVKPEIRILETLSKKRQRYLMYHELQHATHDLLHTALQDYGKEVAP